MLHSMCIYCYTGLYRASDLLALATKKITRRLLELSAQANGERKTIFSGSILAHESLSTLTEWKCNV